MDHSLLSAYALGSTLVSYAAALMVTAYVARALMCLMRGSQISPVGRLLVRGMLAGLSLTAAATLLRLLVARSWDDVAMIAALLALRTGLKQALGWEQRRLGATSPSAPPPS